MSTHTYKQQQISKPGFTLIEVLVAISILLFIMVGPMTIAVQSNRSAEFAVEQAIAFFLAQEGLELAQNARDSYQIPNLYNGSVATPWQEFLDDYVAVCDSAQGCALEIEGTPNPGVAVNICSGNSCRLHIDSATDVRSRYTHTDNAPADEETLYTRSIHMEDLGDAVRVTATVSWRPTSQVTEQEVVVDTYLYNIYDN